MKPETYFFWTRLFFDTLTMMFVVLVIGATIRGLIGVVTGIDIGYYAAIIAAGSIIDSWITHYGKTL